jgi:hypothetical protein
MSKDQITRNLQLAACGAFNLVLLGSLAVPAEAQKLMPRRIAPERGFTVTANAQTPMVLKTEPDSACDLHPPGDNDAAHTMRLYATREGYIRVYVSVKQASEQDTRLQLDCTTAEAATTYPIRLRTGSAPTSDMPAPDSSVPAPRGSTVLPALTEEAARQLSDSDVIALGYPPRPDSAAFPEHYAKWLDMVARPITMVPPDSGARSDHSHAPGLVEAGTVAQAGVGTSSNWSGYELAGPSHTYEVVQAEWNVPMVPVALGEPGHSTSSAFWIGLDGASKSDVPLLQAGTEQDVVDSFLLTLSNYYSWTELVPTQPTEVPTSVAVKPGDDVLVYVAIGNAAGNPNPYGSFFHAWISNNTTHVGTHVTTPLGGLTYIGSHAEWIMERPCLSACGSITPGFADLANYVVAFMTNASAKTVPGTWVPAGGAGSTQFFMYENLDPHPDNNVLSVAAAITSGSSSLVQFNFSNWH